MAVHITRDDEGGAGAAHLSRAALLFGWRLVNNVCMIRASTSSWSPSETVLCRYWHPLVSPRSQLHRGTRHRAVSRAVICGVARRTISAKAGERPHLAVRASRLVDVEVVTALNAGPPPTLNDLDFFQVNAVVESLSERRQRFCAVWRDAAELSQRVQEQRLAAAELA